MLVHVLRSEELLLLVVRMCGEAGRGNCAASVVENVD